MDRYIAARRLKVGDRHLTAGMPMPVSQVTPALIARGHVLKVDEEDWGEACEAFGKPPVRPIPSDGRWTYSGEDPEDVPWASGPAKDDDAGEGPGEGPGEGGEDGADEDEDLDQLTVDELQKRLEELAEARDEKIAVEGTGKGGRILKADLVDAIRRLEAEEAAEGGEDGDGEPQDDLDGAPDDGTDDGPDDEA